MAEWKARSDTHGSHGILGSTVERQALSLTVIVEVPVRHTCAHIKSLHTLFPLRLWNRASAWRMVSFVDQSLITVRGSPGQLCGYFPCHIL